MAGFFLFLFCSVCCFIAAKSWANTYDLGKHSIPDKERITSCIIAIIFGIANLYVAFKCLIEG